MTTEKALDVKNALSTISELLEISPQEVVNAICLLNRERYRPSEDASETWTKFYDADIVDRGKMLGIDIITE